LKNSDAGAAQAVSTSGAAARKPPKKPENLVVGVDERPPLAMTLLLGLPHVFLMSVGLMFPVLVAHAAGASPEAAQRLISLSMLAGGVGTIFQALRNRFIGSGRLCPESTDPSFVPVSIQAAQLGGLPLVYGMTILAGFFEALLSREPNFSKKAADFLSARGAAWGARRDIVQRATVALGETVETIFSAGGSTGRISVTAYSTSSIWTCSCYTMGNPFFWLGDGPIP
jgi:hypothetical protein